MATTPGLYAIRIRGRLGATALSAFPSMVSEMKGSETPSEVTDVWTFVRRPGGTWELSAIQAT